MTGADETFGVGFIGLGNIGGPMARRLVDWPGGLWVFDVRDEATAPFAEAGAKVATDLTEMAEACVVISVLVRDDAQVRDVVDVLARAARTGTIVAIHSTIAPDTAAELATAVAAAGIEIIDAPVSGGAMGAATGELAVMVGGDAALVERCRPVFACWASLVAHLGPVGAGTRAKLARNLLHFVSFAAVGEAMRLAEASGVDLVGLGQVVRHSDAVTGGPGAIMLRNTTAAIPPGDGLRPIFEHTRTLGEKDLHHALDLGAALGVDLPLAELALGHVADALGVPHPRQQP
ncbi:MAG TPA: NAD(P)-dependent oxidoreductase [Acidimicrobiales bacterium]|nr:NAD(P)-dependent oxidoreductase [Acidimicrobiales bacterium]